MPLALLVKSTPAELLILAGSVYAFLIMARLRFDKHAHLECCVPCVSWLFMSSNLNLGIRYVLLLPCLAVLATATWFFKGWSTGKLAMRWRQSCCCFSSQAPCQSGHATSAISMDSPVALRRVPVSCGFESRLGAGPPRVARSNPTGRRQISNVVVFWDRAT